MLRVVRPTVRYANNLFFDLYGHTSAQRRDGRVAS